MKTDDIVCDFTGKALSHGQCDTCCLDLSRFEFCRIGRSAISTECYAFCQVQISAEMQKFRKTGEFKRFVARQASLGILHSIEKKVVSELRQSTRVGNCIVVSQISRARLILSGHSPFGIIDSSFVHGNQQIQFNRNSLSVTVGETCSVSFKNGKLPLLKFQVPVSVRYE